MRYANTICMRLLSHQKAKTQQPNQYQPLRHLGDIQFLLEPAFVITY